jgi:tetratricopeptide (TPR) repeat protein/transglutaminase-like putative cysteine protease
MASICAGLLFELQGAKRRFMNKSIILVGLLAAMTCGLSAQTKPKTSADTAQEAAVVQQRDTRVHYENDGTGMVEHTEAIRIQSEAGVQRYGQLVFGYSSATEKLEVNYVRVRKPDGKTVETPAANAQDFAPEVLESAPMYSDYRERHVTVAGLRPGDLLEYHTTTQIGTPLAPGEFWFEYSFPRHTPITEARLEIDVPKARELHLKSPSRKYTTAETGDRRTYAWVVQNIAPDRKEKDDDAEDTQEEEDEFPDVQLSTFKDWQQVARWYARLQGERVVVDDSLKKKAAELAGDAATQQERARRIYDFVARNIRYVSLSFGVGRYQPHAATEVLAGNYGDCKDKHTLLSALLRAAGIPSYPVLIGSDRKLDEDVPSPAQFDHVITAAQIDKEWVWLDSTAEVAPYGLLLYQLRDKQAVLAADDANGGLKKTPAFAPVKNTLDYTREGKISETGDLDSTIEMIAGGDSAVPYRMIFRSRPQADWPALVERLALFEGHRGKVSDVDVAALEEPAKPLRLRYKIHEDSYFTVPSNDVAWYVFPVMRLGRLPKKKAGKPLDVGPAIEMHSKAHLVFAANYTLRLPPEVTIARDYGQYTLAYHQSNNVLEAEQTYIVKVNQLPPSRRPDVESLRSVATNYAAESIACDVRPASKAALAVAAPAGGTPQELRKAALKALEQRDFKGASDLLKRVVDQKPDSEDAWDELGRAYTGLGSHAEAIGAYRKQVEVNPFHKRAYNDLGLELRHEGKLEDALAAYGKQLDNVPVDSTARKNHGLLLLQLKRTPEALADLEKASSATPDDPEIELALAQLYFGTGQQEKSRALLLSLVGTTAPAPGGDWFAAALRDDIDPEQTLNDARKAVDGIGEQFDAGAYDPAPPEVFSAMYFLALEWARIGWAQFLKGDRLEGMRFLESAWSLSQSGTVAIRLARVYEKTGDTVKAKHMLLLAVAGGGAETEAARAQLARLNAGRAAPDLAQGKAELLQMRSVKPRALAQKSGQAEFVMVFDGSSRPQRVEYREGDAELRSAEPSLTDGDYPVSFPDNSSVKIVRRAVLSCAASGCVLAFKPLDAVQFVPDAQK